MMIFTTVTFMSSGTVPPNWAELVNLSPKCTTYENYKLSNGWTSEWQVPGADDGDFVSDVDDKPKGIPPLVTQEEIPNNQDSNPLVVCGGDIRNQGSDTLFGTTDSIAGIRANISTIPCSETLIAGTRANVGTSQIDAGLNGVETIGT